MISTSRAELRDPTVDAITPHDPSACLPTTWGVVHWRGATWDESDWRDAGLDLVGLGMGRARRNECYG